MALELDRVEKPLRQMRKLLKELAENPAPEQVHRLRTRARKIEAAAGALRGADEKATRRLIKAIKPVRKAAGDVRDMDVLAAKLLEMPHEANGEPLVKLVEHLGTARKASAAKLLDAVDRQRKPARKLLKEYAAIFASVAHAKKPVQRAVARTLDSDTGSDSAADRLMDELARWPALNHQNLHDFRLKVKELRYVLQMFPKADALLVNALGNVKDQIGDWHDWEELLRIARQVLDARTGHELLERIEAISRRKFMQALASANSLRRRHLSQQTERSAAS
jgi:CHAD domain-containing protein